MSLMDLCLRRWYHCTATQTMATATAQFWNKPMVQREKVWGIYRERTLGSGGEAKERPSTVLYIRTEESISAASTSFVSKMESRNHEKLSAVTEMDAT